MARGSQYLAARNVAQGVDGGEGSAGAVRGYELVALFGFACDDAVNLGIDVDFFEEVLADVVE